MIITEEIINEAVRMHSLRERMGHTTKARSLMMKRARMKSLRTIDSMPKLTRRARRAARAIVHKLVIQKMGLKANEMTDLQKIHVSRLVSNKKSLINNIAKRLYGKVRKDDFDQYLKAKALKTQ